MAENMVKVKLLKGCVLGVPGAVVDVPQSVANLLTMERIQFDGHGMKKYRLGEIDGVCKATPNIEDLTSAEALELGIKNVVPVSEEEEEPKGKKGKASQGAKE